jgi:alcohol dehydrogenase class IV
MTDALCQAAIPRGLLALRTLVAGEDAAARDDIAWASLCGGLALANAGLGAVHGLAGVLGGRTPAPHGAICGALLPHVIAANRAALPADSDALAARFDRVIAEIGAVLGATPDHALDRLASWSEAHGLPRLGAMGLRSEDIDEVAGLAAASSSMKANPVVLPQATLAAVLRAAL